MKKQVLKFEGQSFDLGFITVHDTVDSFVAQCKKQNLFASSGNSQDKLLKELYKQVKDMQKLNEQPKNPAEGQKPKETPPPKDKEKEGN